MNDIQADPIVRRRAAFHEAGHAVVLWSFNINVMRLYINDDGDGQIDAQSPNHLPDLDQITIAMAGWAGADVGGCPHSSSKCEKLKSDWIKAGNVASAILGTDDRDADEAAIEALLFEGRDKARKTIEAHRARFEETAERLFLRGELLVNEITILLPSL